MSCELRIGRLIAHPCGRGGTVRCTACGMAACDRHRKGAVCAKCGGTYTEPTASIDIEDFGDPLSFEPAILAAFRNKAGAPEDELAGVDS